MERERNGAAACEQNGKENSTNSLMLSHDFTNSESAEIPLQ